MTTPKTKSKTEPKTKLKFKPETKSNPNPEIRYYETLVDDFIESKNQEKQLPENYKWLRKNPFYIALSYVVYFFVLIWAFIHIKLVKHIKIERKTTKNTYKSRIFYSNHTMPLGDVLAPFIYCFPKRPYIICSPANLGIPVIGRLLPLAGAMPIPNTVHGLVIFTKSIYARLHKGNTIVVYPEAHLWEGCDFIRPLESASFHYATIKNTTVYTSTTVYDGRKIKLILNGPFSAKSDRTKDRQNEIENWVEKTLKENTKNSRNPAVQYEKA